MYVIAHRHVGEQAHVVAMLRSSEPSSHASICFGRWRQKESLFRAALRDEVNGTGFNVSYASSHATWRSKNRHDHFFGNPKTLTNVVAKLAPELA